MLRRERYPPKHLETNRDYKFMRKVEYSGLVRRKLLKLKMGLTGEYGEQKALDILNC